MGTDRFENRHDVALLLARADRAAVNEHGRPIEARDCHHAPGHVLVAAAERDKAVESLRAHGCLDRVRDHLARNERITHPGCSHRNAVGDRDGAEGRALAARRVSALRCGNRELVDVRIARRDVAPRRGNPDLRLAEVAIREAHGAQHGPARRLLDAIEHELRVWTNIDLATGHAAAPRHGTENPGDYCAFSKATGHAGIDATRARCSAWKRRAPITTSTSGNSSAYGPASGCHASSR